MTKRLLAGYLLLSLCLGGTWSIATAQNAGQSGTSNSAGGITPNGVVAEVVSLDAANKKMSVRTEAGASVTVMLDEQTTYFRLPPGERTLDKREAIQLSDIGVGDRVWARGKVAEDQKSVPARMVIVMTKAALAAKNESEREMWSRRSIVGTITAIDAAKQEITVQARSREGAQPVIVEASSQTVHYRRYAPDSVRFSDAKQSDFAALRVGDQVRALGEKSTDGARYKAEEIVSGAFRTIGARITAVNAASGEITVNDMQTNKPITIKVGASSTLKRIPPMVTQMLTQRNTQANGAAGGQPNGAGANNPSRPGGSAQSSRGEQPNGARSERPRGMMGGGDMSEMIDRFPTFALAELKPGEMLLILASPRENEQQLTATTVVAGVDALFSMMQSRAGRGMNSATTGAGMTADALGIGVGAP